MSTQDQDRIPEAAEDEPSDGRSPSGSVPVKQAVVMLGSHWEVATTDVPEEPEIVQRLGRPDGEFRFTVLDQALAKARSVRSRALARKYATSGREASRSPLRDAARRLLASRVLGGRRLLAEAAFTEGEASAAQRAADGRDGWEPEIRALPDRVILPPGVAVESSVWEVTWDHPIEKGIRIRELRVTEVTAYPAGEDEPHDYRIVHRAEDSKGEWTTFGQAGDAHDGRIPDAGLASGALFRTREAAEAQLRAVASMMLGRAEEALRSIGRGRGRAHGAALGTGNAAARVLQAAQAATKAAPGRSGGPKRTRKPRRH